MRPSVTRSPSAHLSLKDRTLRLLEIEGNRRLRRLGTFVYRLTRGRVAPSTRDVLLLTTRGRRSGRDHTILIQGFRDGANLVVAGANGGRSEDPDWFLNLEASPSATVELKGRTFTARAEQLSPEERATFWPRILKRAPSYERYLRTANRIIPLVRLVPLEERTSSGN